MEQESLLLDFNFLLNASEGKGFVARLHGAEGWFSLCDWWNKRDCCLTLIVFLMPWEVSFL